MLKKLVVLFLALIFTFSPTSSLDFVHNQNVRVGISNQSFSSYRYKEIKLSATKDFYIYGKEERCELAFLPKNTIVKVALKDGKFEINVLDDEEKEVKRIDTDGLLSAPVFYSPTGNITIVNLKRAEKQAAYRGVIELTQCLEYPEEFYVVNELNIQDYLQGVVPNEMPVRFGLEALKAQSIAARNYVLKPRTASYKEFDICDSVACQVYFGANTEQPLANKAIKATNNNVALYDGEIILAQYFSTSGGHTENYENVFLSANPDYPTQPIPYLKGVSDLLDPKSNLDSEKNAEKFYKSTPQTFENDSPRFRWMQEWTFDELADILAVNLFKPAYKNFVQIKNIDETDFGELKEIKVLQRGVSGKVISLLVKTSKNEFIVSKELIIRQIFQKDGKNLPSANFVVEETENKDKKSDCSKGVAFFGGGLGHGVGMSQYGAGFMGQNGYSFDEILKHYYSDIQLGTPPVTVSNIVGENSFTLPFYTEAEKALIYLENAGYMAEVIIDINGCEIPLCFKQAKTQKVCFDVSSYLVKGENVLKLTLQMTDRKRKTVTSHLEFLGDKK